MRRGGSRADRSLETRSGAVAASLILACLLVIALVARFSGNGDKFKNRTDQELQELTISQNVPARSDQLIASPFDTQLGSQGSQQQLPQPAVKGQQQVESRLAAKLQPAVLSTFTSGPANPLPPNSPEQAKFVKGYERLKPLISVTSYAPMTYKATRGIIIPAGKSWRLGSAYVALQYLRHTLNCTLPAQIWHTAEEIDDVSKLYFESNFTDVTCIDATAVPYPSHHRPATARGYALKAFALYATSFTEVILLDSDNLPIMDPTLLFDTPEYQLHGSMFWPDLFALPLSRVTGAQAEAYQLLSLTVPWDPNIIGNSSFMFAESGQFLMNRRRHADVLEWAWFINSYGDDGVYSQLMNGDKDSFLLAFALANKTDDYYQVPEWVRLCLHDVPQGEKLEHVGILHHNPQGEVVFLHRTSGGKPNPLAPPGQFFEPHYTTLPLHPQAAWDMFEGAAESQNYRYPKNRIQTGVLDQCKLVSGTQLLYTPDCSGVAGPISEDQLPLPVITQHDLQGTTLGLAYEGSMSLLTALQQFMHEPDHQFLKNLEQLK